MFGGKVKDFLTDLCFDVLGSVIYSVGVNTFTAPNGIAPGGVTGIATMLHSLFGIPIGIVSFAMNIPLFFLALKVCGKKLTLKTLKSVAVLSIVMDISGDIARAYKGNALLAAIFGGVCFGTGLGLIFLRGSTTGGADIIGRYIRSKFPFIQMGKALLLTDAAVLLTAALVYKNIETFLYGAVAIFVSTKVLDTILYGVDTGKIAFIVSDKKKEIADGIIREMDRGCTFLEATGAYSSEKREVLMCAVRKNQFPQLKKITYRVDKNAFFMAVSADEIFGCGFGDYGRQP